MDAHTTPLTTAQVVRNIGHENKIELYKLELVDLIDAGMFYSARSVLNKCIAEVSTHAVDKEIDAEIAKCQNAKRAANTQERDIFYNNRIAVLESAKEV